MAFSSRLPSIISGKSRQGLEAADRSHLSQEQREANACMLSAQLDFSTVKQSRAQTQGLMSPAAHRLILLLEQSRPFLNRYAYITTGQPSLDSPLLRHSFQVILDCGPLTVKTDHYSGCGRFKQGDIWGGDGGCADV